MDSSDSGEGEAKVICPLWAEAQEAGHRQKEMFARAEKHSLLKRKLEVFWKFLSCLVSVFFHTLSAKPGGSIPPSPAGSRGEGSDASFCRIGLSHFLGSCECFYLTNHLLFQDWEQWLSSYLSCSPPLANWFAMTYGG